MKIIWRVDPAPTGRYRSFSRRAWPSAEYEDGRFAANITCADEYHPEDVRNAKHDVLTVRVADWSVRPWKARTMTSKFRTLAEAKKAFADLIEKCPEIAGEAAANMQVKA